ncbi:MAG TPA: M56 family metallopeptidase, partial [Gemmatimonadales bacterium]
MGVLQQTLVLDAIVKTSLILGLTALTAALLRRASASARHMVWALGLMGALAAPALTLALPRWEVPVVRISVDASTIPSTIALPAPSAPPRAHRPSPAPRSETRETATTPVTDPSVAARNATNATRQLPSWSTLLLTIWSLGALVIVGRVLIGLAAVQWMSHRTRAVVDAPWLARAEELAQTLGLSRVRFLRTQAASMPMAWGIVRPSVLMPADADSWPDDRLRIVLLHELAHVKRRDCLTHLFAQLACAAHWFNPLAW